MRSLPGTLRRTLRRPAVIISEVLGITMAGVLLATVPQSGTADPAAQVASGPLRAALHLLAADRVLHSPWFIALVLLATVSLAIVLWDQWRRLFRTWRGPLSLESFRGAQYRRVIERPATGVPPEPAFQRGNRLGLAGSPLLHLGLFLVVLAGLLRATLGQEALVDLVEGQPLAPDPWAYGLQRGGPLARPFALPEPLRVERFELDRYPSGALRDLAAEVRLGQPGAERPVRIAINAPLELGFYRFYVTQVRGPAAFLVFLRPGGAPIRAALFLREESSANGRYTAEHVFDGGTALRLATLPAAPRGQRQALEVTASRHGRPLLEAALQSGSELELPTGERVVLVDLRRWIRFSGTKDPFTGLAYTGFLLIICGSALLFFVVAVDTAVIVEAEPGGVERVTVLLRAHRFAPLQAERFERLVEAARRDTGACFPRA